MTVLILSALVALAVPYYQSYVEESRRAVMLANLQTVKKTLIDYKADNGSYPLALSDLVPKYFIDLPSDPNVVATQAKMYDWGYHQTDGSYGLDIRYNGL